VNIKYEGEYNERLAAGKYEPDIILGYALVSAGRGNCRL